MAVMKLIEIVIRLWRFKIEFLVQPPMKSLKYKWYHIIRFFSSFSLWIIVIGSVHLFWGWVTFTITIPTITSIKIDKQLLRNSLRAK